MGRLVAVSLSPAVDRTYQVPGLRTGALHRVDPPVVSAGGKGVNVARVLSCLGESPLLAGFFAGGTGAFVRRALEQCGVEVLAEEVEGETRTNLNLIDPDAGQETEILEPGPVVDREALQRLSKALVDRVGPGDTVILSGSMPAGVPPEFYSSWVPGFLARGARVVLDTSGAALRKTLPMRPTACKPNRRELASLPGLDLPDGVDGLSAAEFCRVVAGPVRRLQIPWLLLSMGADGACLYTDDSCVRALPMPVQAVNPIGSGDAMTAGLALAIHRNLDPASGLRLATACAVSNALQPSVGLVDPAQVAWLRTLCALETIPCET